MYIEIAKADNHMSTAKYTNFQWVLQIMGRIYKVTLENFTCLESEKFLIWKF